MENQIVEIGKKYRMISSTSDTSFKDIEILEKIDNEWYKVRFGERLIGLLNLNQILFILPE